MMHIRHQLRKRRRFQRVIERQIHMLKIMVKQVRDQGILQKDENDKVDNNEGEGHDEMDEIDEKLLQQDRDDTVDQDDEVEINILFRLYYQL